MQELDVLQHDHPHASAPSVDCLNTWCPRLHDHIWLLAHILEIFLKLCSPTHRTCAQRRYNVFLLSSNILTFKYVLWHVGCDWLWAVWWDWLWDCLLDWLWDIRLHTSDSHTHIVLEHTIFVWGGGGLKTRCKSRKFISLRSKAHLHGSGAPCIYIKKCRCLPLDDTCADWKKICCSTRRTLVKTFHQFMIAYKCADTEQLRSRMLIILTCV